MTDIRITVPNIQTSQEDEIAIIEKLHKSFAGSQSYLESFFTRRMVEWVREQIKNDFVPDVMDYLNKTQNALETARKLHEEDKRLLAIAAADIERLQSALDKGHQKSGEQFDKLIGERDTARRRLNECYTENLSLQDTLKERDETIERMQQKMIELKAKLYDLQNS